MPWMVKYKDIIEKNENLMATLYEYIRERDSEWYKNIQPANQNQIKKLVEISGIDKKGYSLPESYEMYLKAMGQNDGDLLTYRYCGTTNVEDIIEQYVLYKDDIYEVLDMKENEIPIFLNDMETQYYIRFEDKGGHTITINDTNIYGDNKISESFCKFLFQMTFLKYEPNCFKHKVTFNIGPTNLTKIMNEMKINNLLEIIEEYLKKEGFVEVWFCDYYHYIGVKEGASIGIFLSDVLEGFIVGSNSNELGKIRDSICRVMGYYS